MRKERKTFVLAAVVVIAVSALLIALFLFPGLVHLWGPQRVSPLSPPALPPADLTVYPDGTVWDNESLRMQGRSATEGIQWAVDNARTVALVEGAYQIGDVRLREGSVLYGSGSDSTVLTSSSPAYVKMASGSIISSMQTRGHTVVGCETNSSASEIVLSDIISIDQAADVPACFLFRLGDRASMSHVYLFGCEVWYPNTYGFLFVGSRDAPSAYGTFRDVRLQDCKAFGCGLGDRPNDFVVGFDLGELANVDGMVLINCQAGDCWESGFHWEITPSLRNIVVQDCISDGNGQKPDRLYGAGYWLSGTNNRGAFTIINCTGNGNALGLFRTGLGTSEFL